MPKLGQAAQRTNQIDPDLLRATYRETESCRPHCPRCGQATPKRRKGLRVGDWMLAFGHRDLRGEPCRGWSAMQELEAAQ